MKSDDLVHAIGEIDDDLILQADAPPKKTNAFRGWKRWGTVAACFVLLFAILFPLGIRLAKRNAVGQGVTYDLMEGIVPRQRSGIPAPITNDAATAATDFSVRLFREAYDGNNTLISPLSAMLALAMTANGAKGKTLSQMESAFGMSLDDLNEFFYSYRTGLMQTEKCKLALANSIWLRDGFDVQSAFLQTNADYYGADAFATPFDKSTIRRINEWANEKTDGMIPELIDSISPYTVLYLINALSFDAEWSYPFPSDATESGEFTIEDGKTVKVDYMNGNSIGNYIFNEQAQGLVKNYKGSYYSFVALLPNESVSLADFVASLNAETLRTLLAQYNTTILHAKLPKFEIEYTVELSDVLEKMGMIDAFNSAADFSGIGDTTDGSGVYISSVLQKTFLSMNEKGTRAGAATGVNVSVKSTKPPEEVTLQFTRPFVYLLVDTRNNLPLFIGTLNDPTK